MHWAISDYTIRVWNYFQHGGLVMLPLFMVSLMMWTLILNRALFFKRLYQKNMSRKEAGQYIESNRLPEKTVYRGAVSLLVTEFLHRRSGIQSVDRYILDETVMMLVSSLDRYISIIGVLAGIAPLFGLLGTVMGMITTFDVISVFGTGNARAMAGGISEALITTQTGLLVAIPGLYMRSFLMRRAEALKHRIASVGIYLKQHV